MSADVAAHLPAGRALEVWGGLECTVNRVGHEWRDQIHGTGHHEHAEADLAAIADLGIRTLRYPILWERTESSQGTYDWSWADRSMTALRRLGITPVVTLLHHGSGPRWTDLLDEGFASGVEQFARVVAERYPWVTDYTIVNEPLTTARFSGLYGLWYPHARSDHAFVRMLINQCLAVVRGMAAIRRVQPQARLIQTDDISLTTARSAVADVATFYNHRRWLSFDLLDGRVGSDHALFRYLIASGATPGELRQFESSRLDIIGLNYYVTSDRFLDDRCELFPHHLPRAQHDPPYVDLEAARAPDVGIAGLRAHLCAAWQRYGRSVAATEVHLDGPREQQLRWLGKGWDDARAARADGADVVAITPWALFGAVDWNSLVVEARGYYESGAFDARGSRRPTAVAHAIADLIAHGESLHAAGVGPGWWEPADRTPHLPRAAAQLLIVGAQGMLASAFARVCEQRGLGYRAVSRRELDISDPVAIDHVLGAFPTWAIVNAAGLADVDAAECDPARCYRDNVEGAAALATAAATRGLPIVTFSSHMVFSGLADAPYGENASVQPLNVYGRAQVDAERMVAEATPDSLIIRSAALFGPWDVRNVVTRTLLALSAGTPCWLPQDVVVSPTYVPDLVHTALNLLIDRAAGTWHVVTPGAISWFDFVRRAAACSGVSTDALRPCEQSDLQAPAERPRYGVLTSTRGIPMPPLDDALERYGRWFHRRFVDLASVCP